METIARLLGVVSVKCFPRNEILSANKNTTPNLMRNGWWMILHGNIFVAIDEISFARSYAMACFRFPQKNSPRNVEWHVRCTLCGGESSENKGSILWRTVPTKAKMCSRRVSISFECVRAARSRSTRSTCSTFFNLRCFVFCVRSRFHAVFQMQKVKIDLICWQVQPWRDQVPDCRCICVKWQFICVNRIVSTFWNSTESKWTWDYYDGEQFETAERWKKVCLRRSNRFSPFN